jgi:hypothetical protein
MDRNHRCLNGAFVPDDVHVTVIDRSHSQHWLAHAPWPQPHHCYGRYHNGVRRAIAIPTHLFLDNRLRHSSSGQPAIRRCSARTGLRIPWPFAMRTIAFFLWLIATSWSRRHLPAEDVRTRSDTPGTFQAPKAQNYHCWSTCRRILPFAVAGLAELQSGPPRIAITADQLGERWANNSLPHRHP